MYALMARDRRHVRSCGLACGVSVQQRYQTNPRSLAVGATAAAAAAAVLPHAYIHRQADQSILDPYNHDGLHRAIYAEDENQFGFVDNVVLRPLLERFTTVSTQEWVQLKALFDKVGEWVREECVEWP